MEIKRHNPLKAEFIDKYLSMGDEKFYKFLLTYALNKMLLVQKKQYQGKSPEIELLEYHDRMLSIFRQEGEAQYLDVAKLFRKAAHHIYRVSLRKGLTTYNTKFLNLLAS